MIAEETSEEIEGAMPINKQGGISIYQPDNNNLTNGQ